MDLPMLRMPQMPERARQIPWNIGLLICNLTLTTFLSLMVIIVLTEVAPIVPDIVRVLKVVDTTLGDVGVMLPELNSSLWDLHHILPGIRKTIYYTESICKHTSGCV
tara:strand:- start:440 stop:760 length:321 start_codon:yes stop_codon:yes gene_type:complete